MNQWQAQRTTALSRPLESRPTSTIFPQRMHVDDLYYEHCMDVGAANWNNLPKAYVLPASLVQDTWSLMAQQTWMSAVKHVPQADEGVQASGLQHLH